MRLGGGVEKPYRNPEEWLKWVKELQYSAVIFPVDSAADPSVIQDYLRVIRENDLVIGEVGVWRNCLSPRDAERKVACDYAKAQLALAEEVSANCCVNIIGSCSDIWDGFAPENYDPAVYDLAVDSIRDIIDAVKPVRSCYSIEPMPWMVPDSPEQYLQLIRDVDRAGFGVHLDYVNMINCPKRYVQSTEFVRNCFKLLGPHIKSIHGKDVYMEQAFTTLIHEVQPGFGTLNHKEILKMVEALGPDTTFFIEHLPSHETYMEAAAFIRKQAQDAGITVL